MSAQFRKTSPVLKERLAKLITSPLHSPKGTPDLKPSSPSLKQIEFGEPPVDEFVLSGLGDETASTRAGEFEEEPSELGASKVAEVKKKGETPAEDYENIGIFDIYKIGMGPSSSHTNGPMWAGRGFCRDVLNAEGLILKVETVKVDLYGSLALTGRGHRTDTAVILGLMGQEPPTCEPDTADDEVRFVEEHQTLRFAGEKDIFFDREKHLLFNMDIELPLHPNGMSIEAFDQQGVSIHRQTYYSIGGGFIKTEAEMLGQKKKTRQRVAEVPHPFRNFSELFKICMEKQITIEQVMVENEAVYTCGGDIELAKLGLDQIADAMFACVERGLKMEGPMPGSGWLRQSKAIKKDLSSHPEMMIRDQLVLMDYVSLYARAANEENACGGRVVTAPTNGAAGTIPGVLYYYSKFVPGSSKEGLRTFLATAAAIGCLYKRNATISGAEGGCQAEVGAACSMAAAGLQSVMGGGLSQIESAAEIGMEQNLGMTCDPLDGLVQVPCIERNAMAAVKAISASRMAARRCARHLVSLDTCIEVMYRTGKDMHVKYRETSQGGLAILAKEAHPFTPAPYAGF